MHPAEECVVSKKNKPVFGVDFGTRNSIVSMKPQNTGGITFPFHGGTDLQQTIIPGLNGKEFRDLTNLSFVPFFPGRPNVGGAGYGKFSSTVMVYTKAARNQDPLTLYDLGFVPNVQGDVLQKIMNEMGKPGDMGTLLGFYSDLKVSTDSEKASIMQRNAELFIKTILFHCVLNSYHEGCGDIQIRVSLPSSQFVNSNRKIWTNAKKYMEDVYVPADSVHVEGYATEASALFHYVNGQSLHGISRYLAITDGGDGTYDFTINTFENNKLVQPQVFSLRYAGQQIVTDSINTFYKHLVAQGQSVDRFKEMWNRDLEDSVGVSLDEFISQFVVCHQAAGKVDREKEKTLTLMLVEQFGINYISLLEQDGSINSTYNNFVRMVQYKFLFLFNVLGEQVRKEIHFEQSNETAFTIFLYGGTAQALAITEPNCNGDISYFKTYSSTSPFIKFMRAMMHFPKNKQGEEIRLVFELPEDNEKKEIVSGLIGMEDDLTVFTSGRTTATVAPQAMPMGMATGKTDGEVVEDSISTTEAREEERNRRRPKRVDVFIEDLKKLLKEDRKVEAEGKEYSLDLYLPFINKDGEQVLFSQILDDPMVRNEIATEMPLLWQYVLNTNESIDDGDMIYHIFTLEMVSLAIETYLKK